MMQATNLTERIMFAIGVAIGAAVLTVAGLIGHFN